MEIATKELRSLILIIKLGGRRYDGPSLTYSHYVFLINNTISDLPMTISGLAIPSVFFLKLICIRMQMR